MSVMPDNVHSEETPQEIESVPFVRVAPTTLYVAPLCYGGRNYKKRYPDEEHVYVWKNGHEVDFEISFTQCSLCGLSSQCESGQPAELKEVKKGLYERRRIL
jgi:hypothetical protein